MIYWLLTTEYPPFFGGGIGTYCSQTAEMLAAKGHSISVFINDNHISGVKTEQIGNIRIVRFNPSRTGSTSFLGHVTNISYEFAHVIKTFIESEGSPDIIEAQEYLGIAYYLLQYKYLKYKWCENIPVLITMHSPSFLYMEYNQVPMYRYPNYWICEMERFCLQAADQIISPSRFMIDELRKRFELKNQKLDIVPNPFAISGVFTDPLKKENEHQIVFYGKLTAQKGAFKLLTYFKELWECGFQRPLYLLGGQDIVYHIEGLTMGDLIRKKYKKYIQAGLLKMEDRIPPTKIPERLAAAEVVIIPSNNDNLPYVVFEMMALGKILLVSKQGGHTEVIREGKEGFIFDHEKPETFAIQLNHILSLTSEEQDRISANALERVRRDYNADIIYVQKIKIISNLLSSGSYNRKQYPFVRPTNSKETIGSGVEANAGKLSIIVPYFNMGNYIDATINSISQSGYADKEIIIINDGSTDQFSLDQLNKYRNQQNIRVIDIPNGGLAKARNHGAIQATGEYLAFLDADDIVENTYYSKAINILHSYNNVHFTGCWIQYIGDSKDIWPAFLAEAPLILYHNLVNSSALVYKRSSFLAAGMNDTNMQFQGWEDYESVISMVASGFNGVVIPEPLFNYRIRPDSMIRGVSKEKKLFLSQYISIKHRKFYANFAADLFNLLNANGPGVYMDNPSLDHHLADKLPIGGKMSLKLIRLVKKNKYTRNAAYKIYRLLNK